MFEKYADVMSVDDVADATPVCAAVVRDLCRRGELPAVKLGNRWGVPKEWLIQWIQRGGLNASQEA